MNNYALTLSFILFFVFSQAQKTSIYTDHNVLYRNALELYDKGKYSAAQKVFAEVIQKNSNRHDEVRINAEYYYALCALKLFHPDAEFLLQRFVDDHPETPQVRTVYLELGRHYYNNNQFKKAVQFFEKIDRLDLNEDELAEYYFKSGYSYFQLKKYKEAAMQFYEIKDRPNEYKEPALYYYSYISYSDKNYQVALEGFLNLNNSETFKLLVPYYITQIYYLQGDFDKVIAYGPSAMEKETPKRQTEIARLIGDSYYRQMKYQEAVPYLEKFIKTVNPSREESYQMGYAYYRAGFYDKAITWFNRAVNGKDALAQIAYYNLADCYLKLGEKIYARNAFEGASKFDFDPRIQEDALFSYAKLAYELSYNPFHEAINALQYYLDKYPKSPRRDECFSFLINVYITTKNYQAALNALNKIENKDFKMQSAYQLVSFNRGVELFTNLNYNEAIKHFQNVKKYPIERKLNYESKYWIAESYYGLKEYDNAINAYTAFQQEPGAFSSKYYNLANYGIAYCWYNKALDAGKDETYLKNALYSFRKYTDEKDLSDTRKYSDALMRTGDIYFVGNQTENALQFYNQALSNLPSNEKDYALYQGALCKSFLKKYDEAIQNFTTIINNYTTSKFIPDAKFEIAEIYRLQDERNRALEQYNKFIAEYPQNIRTIQAVRHCAAIYYKNKNYPKAEEYYKRILEKYNDPAETKIALEALRDVLKEQNRLDEWTTLVEKYDKSGTGKDEIEFALFENAEELYNKNEYEKAINELNKYIQKFPNGRHLDKARFYRAESYVAINQYDLAIEDYEYLLSGKTSSQTETANMRLAGIYYTKKNFALALKYYQNLEKMASQPANAGIAVTGLMRCYFKTNEWQNAAAYADKFLKESGLTDPQKAEGNFILGTSYMKLMEYDKALPALKKCGELSKNIMGAEARYNIAYIYFLQEQYKKSEKEIFDYIKVKPAYDYWLAKAYILLADNYLMMNDAFQAKATLKSIIDNYTANDDIVPTATEKYNAIIASEQSSGNRKSDIIEIDLNNPGKINEYEE
jgi:tetratricopeptide (TPR) repeat protein